MPSQQIPAEMPYAMQRVGMVLAHRERDLEPALLDIPFE